MGKNLKGKECGKRKEKHCHASIKTTMDRYVHVTDPSLTNAVKHFEESTRIAS